MNSFYRRKKIIVFILSFFIFHEISGEVSVVQNENSETDIFSSIFDLPNELKAEKKVQIERGASKITVKSNVDNASVFLNGTFEGNTPLTLNNLPEGRYRLKVEKNGWKTASYIINIRSGEDRTFYVELKKYEGRVSFECEQENCLVFIDGSLIDSKTVMVEEGNHNIKIKKFGYEPEIFSIYVHRYSSQKIYASLKEADFDVTDFYSNRERYNPNLSGKAGKLEFNFSVTKNSPVTMYVIDSTGNVVFERILNNFTSWNQKITWNGENLNYQKVQNGIYKAKLIWEQGEKSIDFTVDDSITIPFASVTFAGSGIGSLPQAFSYPSDISLFSISAGAFFENSGSYFYGAPLRLSFVHSFSDFFEFSLRGGASPGLQGVCPFLSSAFKITFQKKIPAFNFNWGFFARCGYSADPQFFPYGCDFGNGVGGGGVVGFDFGKIYFGLSSEYVYGSTVFSSSQTDSLWKNGAALQLKKNNLALGIYGAINSSFGYTELKDDLRTGTDFFRSVEAGLDFVIKPSFSDVFFNLKAGGIFFEDKIYMNVEAAFSLLF